MIPQIHLATPCGKFITSTKNPFVCLLVGWFVSSTTTEQISSKLRWEEDGSQPRTDPINWIITFYFFFLILRDMVFFGVFSGNNA